MINIHFYLRCNGVVTRLSLPNLKLIETHITSPLYEVTLEVGLRVMLYVRNKERGKGFFCFPQFCSLCAPKSFWHKEWFGVY